MMNTLFNAVYRKCPLDTVELSFVDVHTLPPRHHPDGLVDASPDFATLPKSLYTKLRRARLHPSWHHLCSISTLLGHSQEATFSRCAELLDLAHRARPDCTVLLGISFSPEGYTLLWSGPSGLECSKSFDWWNPEPLLRYIYTLHVPEERQRYYDDTITISKGLKLSHPPKWDVLAGPVHEQCNARLNRNSRGQITWVYVTPGENPFIIRDRYILGEKKFTQGQLYRSLRRCGDALDIAEFIAEFTVDGCIIPSGQDVWTKSRTIVATKDDTPDESLSDSVLYRAIGHAIRGTHSPLGRAPLLVARQSFGDLHPSHLGANHCHVINKILNRGKFTKSTVHIFNTDNTCTVYRGYPLPGEPLSLRMGTDRYISRSSAKQRILDENDKFSRMPTLPKSLEQRYQAAYEGYKDPLRTFNDPQSTFHGGTIDEEKSHYYAQHRESLRDDFTHLPRLDAEAIVWCILIPLLRSIPVESHPEISKRLAEHEIDPRGYQDDRDILFEKHPWSQLLPKEVSCAGPLVSELIKQIQPEYSLLNPAPHPLHLHEAVQRLLLKYLNRWTGWKASLKTETHHPSPTMKDTELDVPPMRLRSAARLVRSSNDSGASDGKREISETETPMERSSKRLRDH
ncbi:hypothetical protein ONZ45_g14227 [Pleurotus djamor]|nr:hypothetical protein ONZ45_g14227 [Pleurotus djamor]